MASAGLMKHSTAEIKQAFGSDQINHPVSGLEHYIGFFPLIAVRFVSHFVLRGFGRGACD